MRNYKYEIKIDDIGKRLDLTLKEYNKNISRNYIINLIKLGKVKINKKTISVPSYKIRDLGNIEFELAETNQTQKKKKMALNIIYEDQDLIVINKQANILTHGNEYNKNFSLVDLLLQKSILLSNGDDNFKRGVVHRLDKDTSGLIVFAKNDFTSSQLKQQFAERTVKKVYISIVWGKPSPAVGSVKLSIGNYLNNKKKITLNNEGKNALTDYKVIKSYLNLFSFVECKIHTGRTHQIRLHMRSLGCPLVGDKLYAKDRNISKNLPNNIAKAITFFNRQALHAKELSFYHPIKKKQLTFRIETPPDMYELETTIFD